MRFLIYLVLIIPLASCSDKEIVYVEITPDKLTIENKSIDKSEFEKELKAIVETELNSGTDKSRIMIFIKAGKGVSKEEMSEIEKTIRRLGVTREYFWAE